MKHGQGTVLRRRSDAVEGSVLPATSGRSRNLSTRRCFPHGQEPCRPENAKQGQVRARNTYLVFVVVVVHPSFGRGPMPRRLMHMRARFMMLTGTVQMRMHRMRKSICVMCRMVMSCDPVVNIHR